MVCRYEQGLQSICDDVLAKVGVTTTEPVRNANRSKAAVLWVRRETLALLAEFYRDDFKAFDYDPSDEGFARRNRIQVV
jgi:hypothetical protein